jgi:REP element-mobilizing transposase RayT
MNRGIRREAIFRDDEDRGCFMETLGEACEKTGWRVHAYVLMPNHYHLLLETPEANLSEGMQWLHGTYATRFRIRHRLVGHVFQNRFKSPLIEPESDHYLQVVSDYIHLNPVRAKSLLKPEEPLERFVWSSYPYYCVPGRKRPAFLFVDRVLGDLGLRDDASGRRAYRRHMMQRVKEARSAAGRKELDAEWREIREGWCLGSAEFQDRMLDRLEGVLEGKKRRSYRGGSTRGHDEREAQRLLREGIRIVGLPNREAGATKKTDPRKLALAWLIRSRTTMGNQWISDRLCMGHEVNVSQGVRRVREGSSKELKRLRARLEKTLISKP